MIDDCINNGNRDKKGDKLVRVKVKMKEMKMPVDKEMKRTVAITTIMITQNP